jgi:uncharacterized membrane protein
MDNERRKLMFINLFNSYPILYIALTILVVLLALKLEKHSKLVKYISVPVVVIFLGCLFTTFHITPSYAPVFDTYFSYMMPMAAALFVLKFDLSWLYKNGKRITAMFLMTSISTFVFVSLISLVFKFPEKEVITGGIIAEYIGGPQNMLAVFGAVGIDDAVFSQYIFADNVWAIFAMIIVFLLPTMKLLSKGFRKAYDEDGMPIETKSVGDDSKHSKTTTSMEDRVSLWSVAIIGAIGLSVVAIITPLCTWAGLAIENELINQLLSTPLIVAPFLILIIAVPFQKQIHKVEGEDTIAYFIYLMTLFTVGSFTNFLDIFNVDHTMFLLLIVALAINIGFSMVLARIFNIPYEEMCLSVAASYAGPGEAYVIAKSNNWSNHTRLGVMIGLLGYIIGGPLGIFAVNMLQGG